MNTLALHYFVSAQASVLEAQAIDLLAHGAVTESALIQKKAAEVRQCSGELHALAEKEGETRVVYAEPVYKYALISIVKMKYQRGGIWADKNLLDGAIAAAEEALKNYP